MCLQDGARIDASPAPHKLRHSLAQAHASLALALTSLAPALPSLQGSAAAECCGPMPAEGSAAEPGADRSVEDDKASRDQLVAKALLCKGLLREVEQAEAKTAGMHAQLLAVQASAAIDL